MDILNRVLVTSISVRSCLDHFWRPLSVLILKEIIMRTMLRDVIFHLLGLGGRLSRGAAWSLVAVPPLCHHSVGAWKHCLLPSEKKTTVSSSATLVGRINVYF